MPNESIANAEISGTQETEIMDRHSDKSLRLGWLAAAAIVGFGTAALIWSKNQKRNPAQLVEDLVDLCDSVSHNLEDRILGKRDSMAS